MWIAPATTAALLTHVVRGTEQAGYAGLMVSLLRTADAGWQLRELSEDWTSLHDVTGQLIAVLCPDPAEISSLRHSRNYGDTVSRCAAMHGLHLVSVGERDGGLDARFSQSVMEERMMGHAAAVPPRPPREHRVAWTEAASRCAAHFGIEEAQIPAVLMVSFAERTAVLVQLRSRSEVSMYDLCKRVAVDLGWTKRAAELTTRQREIQSRQNRLKAVIDRPVPSRRENRGLKQQLVGRLDAGMTDELRARYDDLDRRLCLVREADPDLVEQWRARLAELRSDGTVEEMYRQLFVIRRHVNGPRDRQKWLRLAAKVGKVIAVTDRVILGRAQRFWDLGDADPIAVESRRQEAETARRQAEADRAADEARQELPLTDDELAAVTAELADVRPKQQSEPGLVAATMSAARGVLGETEVDTAQGRAGLAGYRVHTVRPCGDEPIRRRGGNSVSGGVSGVVVQTGDVTGGVHIHQHGLWGRVRRWFA